CHQNQHTTAINAHGFIVFDAVKCHIIASADFLMEFPQFIFLSCQHNGTIDCAAKIFCYVGKGCPLCNLHHFSHDVDLSCFHDFSPPFLLLQCPECLPVDF